MGLDVMCLEVRQVIVLLQFICFIKNVDFFFLIDYSI